MATKTSGRLGASPAVTTQITAIQNVASAATRNVSRGATTLFGVTLDNQKGAGTSAQIWIKLYDSIANSWSPGTTKAKLGFPVEAWAAADNSQALGTYQVMQTVVGVRFEKGISIAASKEAGDSAAAPPDALSPVQAELIHS